MTHTFRCWLLAAAFAALCSTVWAQGDAQWQAHQDPCGFQVRHPVGWNVSTPDAGCVLVRSADGTGIVVIAPFFLRQRTSARDWLCRPPQLLAGIFPDLQITGLKQTRQKPDEATASISYGGGRGQGALLCSIHGPSGMLFAIGAPRTSYGQTRDILIAILKSFSFTTPTNPVRPGTGAPMAYATFTDPAERAFTVEYPRGWQAQGKLVRRSAIDPRGVFVATSPDGEAAIFFGDGEIPVYAIPSPMLTQAGFPEGSLYSPGYGQVFLVARFLSGAEFAQQYITGRLGQQYPGLQFTMKRNRPDVSQMLNSLYAQLGGMVFTRLSTGEVAFQAQDQGRLLKGYYFAGTQITAAGGIGNWNAAQLFGYLATAEKEAIAQQALDHMIRTFRINPEWAAMQQGLTANVSNIVTETNTAISKMISDGFNYRQGVQDDLSRKWSNMILGMTDVVDPTTGETWKASNGHNYYWGSGNTIVGTEVYERPDINFNPLEEW